MKYLGLIFCFLTLQFQAQDTLVKMNASPMFKYNDISFIEYVGSNIKYPLHLKERNIEGYFEILIMIDEFGAPGNIIIEGENKNLFSDEILRVINLSPYWEPAFKEGVTVDSSFTLKLAFSLHQPNPAYQNSDVLEIFDYRSPINKANLPEYKNAKTIIKKIAKQIDSAHYDNAITLLYQAETKKDFSREDIYYYLGLAYYNKGDKHLGCYYWMDGYRYNDKRSKDK